MNNDRISLLSFQPIFNHLSVDALSALANLFREVCYPQNTKILTKGEPVDSFFIILKGRVEVADEQQNTIVILHPGETIGLGLHGFFSETGVRTANVIAKDNVITLVIDINDFQKFAANHPELNLQSTSEMILRLNFLKHINPFSDIDFAKSFSIMKNISEITVPANTTLFKEGEEPDKCYFLVDGKIAIHINREGHDAVISELTSPAIFGELSVLIKGKRNATAITVTPAKLLILSKEDFFELIRRNKVDEDEIVKLLIDRVRFSKAKNISVHKRKEHGREVIILKNEAEGKYLSISAESLDVWELLDGNHTLQDIALAFYKKYNEIVIDEIAALIWQLIQSGFIDASQTKSYLTPKEPSFFEKVFLQLRKVMEFNFIISKPNTWLTTIYKKLGFIFYNKIIFYLMTIICICGFLGFVCFTPYVSQILQNTKHAWLLLVLQSPLLLIVMPLHELAHALTAKHFGRQVRLFGIGWFWIGPIAFTDTSDMWLSERRPRLAVTFSGIFLNLVLAGLFSLFAWLPINNVVAVFSWLFALSNYLAAFANLNPLLELDGYFLLMDYFDKPNLRFHALTWIIEKRNWDRESLPEISYWISCFVYLIVAVLLAIAVQHFILNPVLPQTIGRFHISNLQWILPTIVIFLSFVSLYVAIKRQQKHVLK